MKHLIECVQNVRYGRTALRWGAPDAARVHVDCARHWIITAACDRDPRDAEFQRRMYRVLGLVNALALDLIFIEAGCSSSAVLQ